MYSNNHIYRLERYRSCGSNRYICPQCGRKKCFTRYVNIETGQYLADNCGKCNHKSSCGYHYPPHDYFNDHPDINLSNRWDNLLACEKALMSGPRYNSKLFVPQEFVQTEFFNMSWVDKACERQSTFRRWLEQLPFDHDRIEAVLKEYYVGATAQSAIRGGVDYGPATVFWMIDEKQRVHDAKVMAYSSDGHRVQGCVNTMRSICEKAKTGPQLAETEKVFFGLHLLPRYPEKVVCIVESEKSALICALRFPQYLWLATGGCGNLKPSKLRPLMNRFLVVFPDSGEYQEWSKKMKESGHPRYSVVDFLEAYERNTDIADVILGIAKRKEEDPLRR